MDNETVVAYFMKGRLCISMESERTARREAEKKPYIIYFLIPLKDMKYL